MTTRIPIAGRTPEAIADQIAADPRRFVVFLRHVNRERLYEAVLCSDREEMHREEDRMDLWLNADQAVEIFIKDIVN